MAQPKIESKGDGAMNERNQTKPDGVVGRASAFFTARPKTAFDEYERGRIPSARTERRVGSDESG